MAEAKFDEEGNLVNVETGEILGNVRNGITFDSVGAELKSLEDYGVELPEFPEEKEEKEDIDEDFDGNTSAKPVSMASQFKPMNNENSSVATSHIDNGKTSFKVQRSKYEVTKDSYFIIQFGLLQEEGGRFVPIQKEDVERFPQAEMHWVKFRVWTYEEELNWKSEFLEYNNVSKSQGINVNKLNERKIKCLMLDWSFGEYDDRLKLLHCDGKLSDESYGIFMGMYPSIATTIVDMMNLVLESNQ